MNKILVIGSHPKSLIQFRGELLHSFRKSGCKVIACASGECTETINNLSIMGIDYIPAPINRTSINPLHDLILLFQLMLIIRRVKPDCVLTYTVKPVIYGMLAARISGIQQRYAMITGLGYAFISSHSFGKKILKLTVSFLYKLSLAKAKAVFFQNNDDLNLFRNKKIIGEKSHALRVMGSGVDIEHFKFTQIPSGKLVFLLIARLLNDKGIREYVEAARIVKEKRPNDEVNFLLLGSFDSNPAAIQPSVIEQWVSDGFIKYLGSTDDVRSYIEQCSVFVLPSYREGMPRSVLEAMSMGRAIITTDTPGCRDTVVHNENGYLVPVKSIKELSIAMLKLIDNRQAIRKMGIKSRKMAEESFDVSKVNKVILEEMGIYG